MVRLEHTIADDSQTPGTLGHEHAAVWQKRHAPRLVEPPGHREPHLMLNGGVENDGAVGQPR